MARTTADVVSFPLPRRRPGRLAGLAGMLTAAEAALADGARDVSVSAEVDGIHYEVRVVRKETLR
jgi:hypothetical protein